jgi:hypothetical protein
MARDLLKLIPFEPRNSVLDPCSGRNKVWLRNFPSNAIHLDCEIEEGSSFFDWCEPVDWIVGNPPFSKGVLFTEHAMRFCRKGIAYLGNHNFINSLFLPSRMEKYKGQGWAISRMQIVQDKRWFGRYYFVIFRHGWEGDLKLGWTLKSYTDGPVDSSEPNGDSGMVFF